MHVTSVAVAGLKIERHVGGVCALAVGGLTLVARPRVLTQHLCCRKRVYLPQDGSTASGNVIC